MPTSGPYIAVILKYPPFTFLVTGQLEMVALFQYPPLTNQCMSSLQVPYFMHTVQITPLETVDK